MAGKEPDKEVRRKGPQLEAHQVIVRPIITEKGTHLVERHNTYAFEVHPTASKPEIRAAVEELFQVRVLSVRTQARQGKTRRYRHRTGRTAAWKKAFVTLSENDRIALF